MFSSSQERTIIERFRNISARLELTIPNRFEIFFISTDHGNLDRSFEGGLLNCFSCCSYSLNRLKRNKKVLLSNKYYNLWKKSRKPNFSQSEKLVVDLRCRTSG